MSKWRTHVELGPDGSRDSSTRRRVSVLVDVVDAAHRAEAIGCQFEHTLYVRDFQSRFLGDLLRNSRTASCFHDLVRRRRLPADV